MKSDFQRATREDAPAIREFLQRVRNLDSSAASIQPEQLEWKCFAERPDWEGSRAFVVWKDGRIAAYSALIPLTLLGGGRRLRMAHMIDWAADPASVGAGSVLLARLVQMVDALIAAGGSEMTQKILPALGAKVHGVATRFVRPLRPLRRLRTEGFGPRPFARLARSVAWKIQTRSIPLAGWSVARVAPEKRSDGVWPLPTPKVAVFERSASLTAYFLKCPTTSMEYHRVAASGGQSGYFILAQAPGQARIADFFVDSEDPRDWCALLQLAASEAQRKCWAVEAAAIGSDPVTRRALKGCGFHARGDAPLWLLAGKNVTLPAEAIRFQMIDNDEVYLHANQDAYWS